MKDAFFFLTGYVKKIEKSKQKQRVFVSAVIDEGVDSTHCTDSMDCDCFCLENKHTGVLLAFRL